MTDVPNPLNLLWRFVQEDDPSATEVLLFTFNHDLAFFERSALGMIQQTGARITLVADARMAHHDLYAVRRAGTAYLPGLAHCTGSFHPKVLVVASQARSLVAIGSGNLSMSGWQANDELWSVHTADHERGSSVVGELAPWLRQLPTSVRCGDGVSEALARAASLLDGLAATDTSARLVHSLERPIIEQLPDGPVDVLSLYAPFHDPGAHAVRALLDQFRPTDVRVAVQPTLTRVNGAELASVLGDRGAVTWLGDAPYRHGKLIEWEQDGKRWALTGSPNLSSAALLRSVLEGGNVEIGVVAPASTTLLPEGQPAPVSKLAGIPYVLVTEPPRPAVVLLSAVLRGEDVVIRFARPLEQAGALELSSTVASPDTWHTLASLSAGQETVSVSRPLVGGDRVRVRLVDGSVSPAIFVVDPVRVLRLRRAMPAGRRPPSLDEIFTDARAVEQLARLMEAAHELRSTAAPSPAPSRAGPTGTGDARSFELDSWDEYLDRCQGRIGADTLSFALGLPIRRARASSQSVVDIDWDDEGVDEDDLGSLDEDEAEALEDDSPEVAFAAPSLWRAPEKVRRRYRAAAERMINDADRFDLLDRLVAVRLSLLLVAAGAWAPTDESWRELILLGTTKLDDEELPSDYEELAGSLAALALSIVHATLERYERTVTHIRFEQAVRRLTALLLGATKEQVEQYAEGLDGRFPGSADASAVLELRDRLVYPDPVSEAVEFVSGPGVHAFADGAVVTVLKDVSSPLLLACEVLVKAESVSPLVIRAGTPRRWTTLLWDRPTLVIIQPGKFAGSMFCDVLTYPTSVMPSHDVRTEGRPRGARVVRQTSAGAPLPDQAVSILAAVGLETPALEAGVDVAP